jgi:hypothetical protein
MLVQKKKTQSKGIVIITTMLAILFLVMFSSGLVTMTMIHQQNSFRAFQDEAVRKAAEAGISYAMMRLETEPGWQGCLPAEKPGEPGIAFHIDNPETGLTVYEHPVADNKGWVEGRINIGGYDCYFDLYFTAPPSGAKSHFFGSGKPGGKMPGKILLCQNNLSVSTSPTDTKYSDGTVDSTKKVAKNAVLIVSRGSAGNTTRSVETSFKMEIDLAQNSVAVAKGHFFTTITGFPENKDRLTLSDSATGSSIMRAVGNMVVNLSNPSAASNDYLNIKGASGGKADGLVFALTSKTGHESKFIKESGQVNFLPEVTPEDAIPPAVASKITNTLSPGIYFFSDMKPVDAGKYPALVSSSPDDFHKKYPRVHYHVSDDYHFGWSTFFAPPTSAVDITEKFIFENKIGQSGEAVSWDYNTRTLALNESFKVGADTSGKGLKNVVFSTLGTQRLTVQVGQHPESGTNTPTYLVNQLEGGSIFVNGELSGSGTVYADANVVMETESQLHAVPDTGISIYAGGDVKINELKRDPFIRYGEDASEDIRENIDEYNTRQSILNKIESVTMPYVYNSAVDVNIQLINADIFTKEELDMINKESDNSSFSLVPPGSYGYYNMDGSFFDSYRLDNTNGILFYCKEESPNRRIMPLKGTMGTSDEVVAEINGDLVITPEDAVWLGTDNDAPFDEAKEILPQTKSFVQSIFNRPDLIESPDGEPVYDENGRLVNIRDSIFRGLVYAGKTFNVSSPNYGFKLTGGLVAKDGSIQITAKDCGLTYDTRYLQLLNKQNNVKVNTLYWVER